MKIVDLSTAGCSQVELLQAQNRHLQNKLSCSQPLLKLSVAMQTEIPTEDTGDTCIDVGDISVDVINICDNGGGTFSDNCDIPVAVIGSTTPMSAMTSADVGDDTLVNVEVCSTALGNTSVDIGKISSDDVNISHSVDVGIVSVDICETSLNAGGISSDAGNTFSDVDNTSVNVGDSFANVGEILANVANTSVDVGTFRSGVGGNSVDVGDTTAADIGNTNADAYANVCSNLTKAGQNTYSILEEDLDSDSLPARNSLDAEAPEDSFIYPQVLAEYSLPAVAVNQLAIADDREDYSYYASEDEDIYTRLGAYPLPHNLANEIADAEKTPRLSRHVRSDVTGSYGSLTSSGDTATEDDLDDASGFGTPRSDNSVARNSAGFRSPVKLSPVRQFPTRQFVAGLSLVRRSLFGFSPKKENATSHENLRHGDNNSLTSDCDGNVFARSAKMKSVDEVVASDLCRRDAIIKYNVVQSDYKNNIPAERISVDCDKGGAPAQYEMRIAEKSSASDNNFELPESKSKIYDNFRQKETSYIDWLDTDGKAMTDRRERRLHPARPLPLHVSDLHLGLFCENDVNDFTQTSMFKERYKMAIAFKVPDDNIRVASLLLEDSVNENEIIDVAACSEKPNLFCNESPLSEASGNSDQFQSLIDDGALDNLNFSEVEQLLLPVNNPSTVNSKKRFPWQSK